MKKKRGLGIFVLLIVIMIAIVISNYSLSTIEGTSTQTTLETFPSGDLYMEIYTKVDSPFVSSFPDSYIRTFIRNDYFHDFRLYRNNAEYNESGDFVRYIPQVYEMKLVETDPVIGCHYVIYSDGKAIRNGWSRQDTYTIKVIVDAGEEVRIENMKHTQANIDCSTGEVIASQPSQNESEEPPLITGNVVGEQPSQSSSLSDYWWLFLILLSMVLIYIYRKSK